FTDIAEVFLIAPPVETRPTIAATHYGSTADEFILGLANFGECAITMNFIPGSPSEAMLMALGVAAHPIRVTWPNAATWTFNGIKMGYEVVAPLDNRMTAKVTFKVTGSVVRA